jgi:hypothetical protein
MQMLTILKTHKFFFVVAVSTALALTGCSSTHKAADKKLIEENFTLTYKDKAQANGDIGKLILQHPLSISEKQIVFHMVALSYEPFSLFGKASSVFTKGTFCQRWKPALAFFHDPGGELFVNT